jgi:hypothetical protein
VNHAAIRYWLLKQPRPASLRLTVGTTVSALAVAAGASWMQVAKSVEAMAPDLLEALDSAGNLIRAVRAGDEGEEDTEATPAPALPAAATDPETARFTLIANLLAQAHANSFNALVSITATAQAEANSLRLELARIDHQRREDLADREDMLAEREERTKEDPLSQVVGAFAQGQGAAAASKTNGKA